MTRLRVTERCVRDDLNIDAQDATRDAQYLAAKHEAIRVFVGKRSGAPGEGENVLGVRPYGHVKSLHAGQGRGATIYDEEADVCWLLAYSDTHAVGERRDAYKHFERLDSRDEFLPTESDYAALETVTSASLMDALHTLGSGMIETARAQLGHEVTKSFTMDDGQDASITVSIELVLDATDEAEQGWIAFVLPHDAPLDRNQLLDLIADILPPYVEAETVQIAADVNGRPVAFSEIAFTWDHYTNP